MKKLLIVYFAILNLITMNYISTTTEDTEECQPNVYILDREDSEV